MTSLPGPSERGTLGDGLWNGGCRLVGKGHHHSSLHTLRADAQAQSLEPFSLCHLAFFLSSSSHRCREAVYVEMRLSVLIDGQPLRHAGGR